MRLIGSILVKDAPDAPTAPPPDGSTTDPPMATDGSVEPFPSDSSILSVTPSLRYQRLNILVYNDWEPLHSTDEVSPPNANFYKSDDYVYHRINGKWKRTSINVFNNT